MTTGVHDEKISGLYVYFGIIKCCSLGRLLKLNGEKDNSTEGQHQFLFELVSMNMSAVSNDVINKLQLQQRLQCQQRFCKVHEQLALCSALESRWPFRSSSLVRYLLEAQRMLSIIDKDDGICCLSPLPVIQVLSEDLNKT